MPSKGDFLGHYRIVRELGSGGMGTVYEAVHTRIRTKKVAIKLLHPSFATRKEVIKRFEREAEAAAAVDHDGIVDIYDVGVSDEDVPFLVMEYLQGQSLSDLLVHENSSHQCAPIDQELSLFVITQVLSALTAAHSQGVVHRDLKPDNIFLSRTASRRPKVKLLDFGIARFNEFGGSSDQCTLTKTGTVMGTPYFMSPEQALGETAKIDHRTDIWAVGVILYKCLTGHYPFSGGNYNQVMAKIISHGEPAELQYYVPSISPGLQGIINRSLCKDINRRYLSANEMLAELIPFLSGADIELLGLTEGVAPLNSGTLPQTLDVSSDRPMIPTIKTTLGVTNLVAVIDSPSPIRSKGFRVILGLGIVVLFGVIGAIIAFLQAEPDAGGSVSPIVSPASAGLVSSPQPPPVGNNHAATTKPDSTPTPLTTISKREQTAAASERAPLPAVRIQSQEEQHQTSVQPSEPSEVEPTTPESMQEAQHTSDSDTKDDADEDNEETVEEQRSVAQGRQATLQPHRTSSAVNIKRTSPRPTKSAPSAIREHRSPPQSSYGRELGNKSRATHYGREL